MAGKPEKTVAAELENIRQWGPSVLEMLEACDHHEDAQKVRTLVELAQSDNPDPLKFAAAVEVATLPMTLGVAQASAEQYQKLIGPSEQLLKELDPSSKEYLQVQKSIEVYKLLVAHHNSMLQLLQKDLPNMREEIDKLTAKAEKRLAELGAELEKAGALS